MKNRKVLVLVSTLLIAVMSVLLVACTTADGLEKKFKNAGYDVTREEGKKEDGYHWKVTASKKGSLGAFESIPGVAGLKKYAPDFMATKYKSEEVAKAEEAEAKQILAAAQAFGKFKDRRVERKGTVLYFGKNNELDYALGKKLSLQD